MAKFKTAKSATKDNGYANSASTALPGGDTDLTGNQFLVRVKIGTNSEADGYIIKQKGSKKFLVTDGTNTGVCALANLDDSSLTANTMTVTCVMADSTAFKASKITNKFVWDQDGNKYLVGVTADDTTTPETVAVEAA